MAQQLQNITITAPGFAGVNTQDAPLAQNPSFCKVADNCIIDKEGRIAARKGTSLLTSNSGILGASDGITAIKEFRDHAGNNIIFSTGNNLVFTGTTTLVDVTPAAYSISADDWKIVAFNQHIYFFQRDYEPLVYATDSGVLEKMSDHSHAVGTPPEGNEVLAAFGRLWVADFPTDKATIQWSDLLDGSAYSGGSSGSIDISKVWPNGYDEIVALGEHNGFLVIFGKESIVIYQGADNPATMSVVDTISSIGCVSRDCVTSTGKDLIFLDKSGLRSLARTIQEKSAPIGDISKNVSNDIKTLILNETGNIKVHYSPVEAFILVNFQDQFVVYVFDTKFPLEDGSFRVTTWTGMRPLCFTNLADDTLYIGTISGIATYSGYTDNSSSYQLSYFSHPLSFGSTSTLKFLKNINLTTFNGEEYNIVLNWAYDYSESYKKQSYFLPASSIAQYNIAEYNVEEYSSSISLINRKRIKATGQGAAVSVGVETTINGNSIAIQEINIQALVGRLI